MSSRACVFLPGDPESCIPCNLINVSASGVRIQVSQDLSFGQVLVLDLEHHLVAAETRNSQGLGAKFEVGMVRLRAVSKLDHAGSGGAQVLELMKAMGWKTGKEPFAPNPVSTPEPPVSEPELAPIETPVNLAEPEPEAAPIETPVCLAEPEPAPAESPLTASPKLADLVPEHYRLPISKHLPIASQPEPLAVAPAEVLKPALAPVVLSEEAVPETVGQVPEEVAAVAEVAAGAEEAPVARDPEPAPAEPPAAKPVAPTAPRGLPRWIAIAAGLLLAGAAIGVVARLNINASVSVLAKVPEKQAAVPVTKAPDPAPAPAAEPTPTPAAAEPSRAAVANPRHFVISAREPSWIGINVDGKVVFQKMLAKGESTQAEFSKIAYVHVGNASNVDLKLGSRAINPLPGFGALRLLELTDAGARVLPWRNDDPRLPALPATRSRGDSATQ